ncbi:MAG TPA: hypothetical protein DG942_02080 [Ruminococcaceae bacterium]|jgi:hypothetical protein|nr:hypothetical protein [Oscillospiraceae bacterium]
MSLVIITNTQNGISYYMDVTFKETHTFTNEITQNPVQEGANINDHVYHQPVTFMWDVGMSDCLGSVISGQFSSSAGRSTSAFEVLESLWRNTTLLTITTSFKQYNNMLIKSFVVTKDKHTMFGMKATVLFQEIITVAATDIPVTAKQSSDAQTTNKNNAGAKTTTPSSKTHKITIPFDFVRTATYNGKTYSIEDYFNKFSSSKGKNDALFQYTITPIIPSNIANATTFHLGKSTLNYQQLLYVGGGGE